MQSATGFVWHSVRLGITVPATSDRRLAGTTESGQGVHPDPRAKPTNPRPVPAPAVFPLPPLCSTSDCIVFRGRPSLVRGKVCTLIPARRRQTQDTGTRPCRPSTTAPLFHV